MYVMCMEAEAELIWAELEAHSTEIGNRTELDKVSKQIDALLPLASLPAEEFNAQRLRCVFLSDEGTCNIYGVRPTACRRWHSMDAEDCKQAYDMGWPTDINVASVPASELVYDAVDQVSYGVQAAMAQLGYGAPSKGWIITQLDKARKAYTAQQNTSSGHPARLVTP
jgi:Fe-S-cluster containining protein